MGQIKAAPVPTGLATEGRALWRDIAGQVANDDQQLDARERRWLRDACDEADMIATLKTALVGAPLLVRGSQGQDVAHPLIGEIRQHRTTLAALLARLKLDDPDAVEGVGSGSRTTSVTARRAALIRHYGEQARA